MLSEQQRADFDRDGVLVLPQFYSQQECEELRQRMGDAAKKLCKAAIRTLMDSGRCVYTYFGGSFIEIPHQEGAAEDSAS